MTLSDYLEHYVPRMPKVASRNTDEDRLLTAADGVATLAAAPFPGGPRSTPNAAEANQARHLWVFKQADPDLPAIRELAVVTPPLQSGRAKHTNLTGGQLAACGGELWVDPADNSLLYVNGASGRYGPDSQEALAAAVTVFEDRGFTVRSFGWDPGNNLPARFYREP